MPPSEAARRLLRPPGPIASARSSSTRESRSRTAEAPPVAGQVKRPSRITKERIAKLFVRHELVDQDLECLLYDLVLHRVTPDTPAGRGPRCERPVADADICFHGARMAATVMTSAVGNHVRALRVKEGKARAGAGALARKRENWLSVSELSRHAGGTTCAVGRPIVERSSSCLCPCAMCRAPHFRSVAVGSHR
jgi:hypothetical protein